jgi:hypothetical protein
LLINVMRDEVQSPFIVGDIAGECLLLDGHNRYEICLDHSLEYPTPIVMKFATRDDAKIWIINNQLGRRNLNDAQRIALALKLEPLLKAKGKENQKTGGGDKKSGLTTLSKPIDTPAINTRKEVAKSAGVSEGQVAKFKVIADQAPEIKQDVLTGKTTINKAHKQVALARPATSLKPGKKRRHKPSASRLLKLLIMLAAETRDCDAIYFTKSRPSRRASSTTRSAVDCVRSSPATARSGCWPPKSRPTSRARPRRRRWRRECILRSPILPHDRRLPRTRRAVTPQRAFALGAADPRRA